MTQALTDRLTHLTDRLTHLTAEAYAAPCPPKLTHDFRCALGEAQKVGEVEGESRGRKSQRAANEVMLKIREEYSANLERMPKDVRRIYRWLQAARDGESIRKQNGYSEFTEGEAE